jgi:hypothetical protein
MPCSPSPSCSKTRGIHPEEPSTRWRRSGQPPPMLCPPTSTHSRHPTTVRECPLRRLIAREISDRLQIAERPRRVDAPVAPLTGEGRLVLRYPRNSRRYHRRADQCPFDLPQQRMGPLPVGNSDLPVHCRARLIGLITLAEATRLASGQSRFQFSLAVRAAGRSKRSRSARSSCGTHGTM